LNGSVTVLPGKSLTVSGNLTNTAGASGLIIKADADQLKANGSLIFNNPQTIPVNATVEMFSKASWDLNQSAGSKYKWQFFGIPFKSLKASPAFDGAYVRRLNEKGDSIGHWLQLSNDSVLTKFTGYEITQPGAKTYTFSGELVNKDTTINLPYTSGAYRPGQYLFCNPYTAAIDLTIPSKILFGENTEESVYLYNTGTLKDWETTNGATVVGTAPGQYSVSPAKVAGDAGIPGQIPSMQGFLIKATGPIGSTGQITIPYSSLVKNNELQRAPSKNKSGSSDKVYTKIDIQGSRFADRMWIFSDSSCTPFFDNGWDGYKLKGSFLTPQLYSMGIDGDYQVNAVADMNNTQLGFQAGEDSEYTLTFTNENLLTLYSAVFLVDFVANKTIDITTSGTTYSFVSEPTPTTVKRFKIFTLQNKKDAPDINTQINVFNSGNTVFVQNLSNLNGEMRVYDMMGRTIKSTTFGPFGVTSVQLGNITGAYIVQATTDFNKVSEKIIIAKE